MKKALTIDQAARLLSVHPNTIYRMIKAGEIKAVKIRARWRIKEQSIASIMGEDKDGRSLPQRQKTTKG